MILFKSCTRCGGDVDATYAEDTYCIQCSHRPADALPAAAAALAAGSGGLAMGFAASQPDSGAGTTSTIVANTCPRCKSRDLVQLDRLRRRDHVCYRCRPCGHIFSPARAFRGERVG